MPVCDLEENCREDHRRPRGAVTPQAWANGSAQGVRIEDGHAFPSASEARRWRGPLRFCDLMSRRGLWSRCQAVSPVIRAISITPAPMPVGLPPLPGTLKASDEPHQESGLVTVHESRVTGE